MAEQSASGRVIITTRATRATVPPSFLGARGRLVALRICHNQERVKAKSVGNAHISEAGLDARTPAIPPLKPRGRQPPDGTRRAAYPLLGIYMSTRQVAPQLLTPPRRYGKITVLTCTQDEDLPYVNQRHNPRRDSIPE